MSGDNWDIYRRSYDPAADQWSAIERMTYRAGRRHQRRFRHRLPRATCGGPGRDGGKSISRSSLTRPVAGAEPIAVTDNPANHWDPAIAADSKGNVYVAWDSYENGNYDVFMQRFQGGPSRSR